MKIIVMGGKLVASTTLEDAARTFYPDASMTAFKWFSDVTKEEFKGHIKDIELNGPESQELPKGLLEAFDGTDMLMLHYGPVSIKTLPKMNDGALVGVCQTAKY